MAKFAQNTDVSVEQSEAEIKRTIARYGATSFMSGYQGNRAVVAFEMDGKRIRFNLNLPEASAQEFTTRRANQHEGSSVPQNPEKANQLWQQACRQRWRALLLLIKAKLEAVEGNITTFEEEMLAHIVMHDGRTVAETILPDLPAALERGGSLPPLLGTDLPPATTTGRKGKS